MLFEVPPMKGSNYKLVAKSIKMKNNIYIKDDKLIIEIPMTQTRSNPYDDWTWVGDNIIGIVEPQSNCNVPRIGFAYRIDMSYKDKGDQWTDIFYEWDGEEEDFNNFCSSNGIEVYKYHTCAYCHGAIYGCFTLGKKGFMCHKCELKKSK